MKRMIPTMKRIGAAIMLSAILAACGGGGSSSAPPASTTQGGQPSTVDDSTAQQPSPSSTGTQEAPSPGDTSPSGAAGTSASGQTAGTSGTAQAVPGAGAVPVATRKVGELIFATGDVSVHRAGGVKAKIDIGDVVLQYDVIATGPGSRAEIDLASGYPGGATVKLSENTAFYFDTKALSEDERRTVIQLLAGALAVKVDKLANGSFNIAADGAVLGVRGTVFIVDTVPDGALLVTTNEGAVQVKSNDGATVVSRADQAAELPADGGLAAVAVDPATASAFRTDWRNDALASFTSQAIAYTSGYAKSLDDNRASFNSALARLKSQDAVLTTWRDARAAGKEPRFTDWIPEKKAVAAVLFDCLKALFLIERPYYRLVELKSWHDTGVGVGTLKDGRDSTAYFKGFSAANNVLAVNMARVREALDLFGWAGAGSPVAEFFGSKAAGLGSGALFLGGEDW